MRLPGFCIACGAEVTWTGKRWQDSPVGRGTGRRHVCPKRCGYWMPQARERCARRPGHHQYHASRDAVDNAAGARRKPVAA